MEYEVYKDPARVVITSDWGDIQTAEIKRDTQVRYQGGVKSPILTEVSKGSKVVVLDADLAGATMTKLFKAQYPERFFDF